MQVNIQYIDPMSMVCGKFQLPVQDKSLNLEKLKISSMPFTSEERKWINRSFFFLVTHLYTMNSQKLNYTSLTDTTKTWDSKIQVSPKHSHRIHVCMIFPYQIYHTNQPFM